MDKRKVIFGGYDTAERGAWTVAQLTLTSPDLQSNLVYLPGRSGPLDLSTALTGEPVYNSRSLTVVLENSDGDREYREQLIRGIVSELDGMRKEIWLPDDPDHYLQGRVRVTRNYNDLAHAAVTVTATCDPWLFNNEETVYTLTATDEAQTATFVNNGRKSVVPVVQVTDGSVSIKFNTNTWNLSAGIYTLPDFVLSPGDHELTYSGAGTIQATYREAVLL